MKSKPVRRRFVRQLEDNLRAVLLDIDPAVVLHRSWDKVRVKSRQTDTAVLARMVQAMCNTPGVTLVLKVQERPLPGLDAIVELVLPVLGPRLQGRTIAVRCKRSGQHPFSSQDVERQVGAAILARAQTAGVRLDQSDVTVKLEISGQMLFMVSARYQGLGGFPVGSVDPVLSLFSGGFDSPVASYLTMKRGMRTHFLFFRLGGREQELAVKRVALHLWHTYGGKQRVLFIIRHPDEQEKAPLHLHVPVIKIPFYELSGRVAELAPHGTYMLYCDNGSMSRIHAGRLREHHSLEVKVYAPARSKPLRTEKYTFHISLWQLAAGL